ncbi:MAG TPA: iron-containing redox enzyme family protein [Pseudomonadota bacterium]|nr:iron-containing redox enzyme family protein [Pseudomonadota bacterium]
MSVQSVVNRKEFAKRICRMQCSFVLSRITPREHAVTITGHEDLLQTLSSWSCAETIGKEQDTKESLLRYAPTALLPGSWLFVATQVRGSHTPLSAALQESLYLQFGAGHSARHRGNQYRALLRILGETLPPLSSRQFAFDRRFQDTDFDLPLYLLSVGGTTEHALPEVLGVHAAMTLFPPPKPVEQAAQRLLGTSFLAYFDPHSPLQKRAEQLLRNALQAYEQQRTPDWPRILHAARTVFEKRTAFCATLLPQEKPSPWASMMAVVQAKFRNGFGFHGRVRLAGKPLDAFFDPDRPDLAGFLEALSHSQWIVPGHPEQSPLLSTSTQFGGSMLGIFTTAELDAIATWISALPDSAQPGEKESGPIVSFYEQEAHVPDFSRAPVSVDAEPETQDDVPALYKKFLCETDDPACIRSARQYVLHRMAEAACAGDERKLVREKLWPWSARALSEWVWTQHHQQVFGEKPGPSQGCNSGKHRDNRIDEMGPERHLEKKDVLWLICQMAPAAFIDGAWLQGICTPALSSRASATPLFQIYRDELGTGNAWHHHGNILRRMLAEQGISLPQCDSQEFVTWPAFLKESFCTPVLWLALSLHAQEFYPELLGMNLAIELAGVGKAYGRAITLLQSHSIDPCFFKAHNTVDNVASGHTAWAMRAIGIHMNEILDISDDTEAGRVWQRIWRGYAMYEKSSSPLVKSIALRIGPTLGWKWLQNTLFS